MRSKTITRAALVAAFGAAMVPMLSGAITTKTQTFDVTLKISADCIIATSTLDLGQSQGLLATAVNQTSQLQVTCTNTTPYNIGLNAGTGSLRSLTVYRTIPAQSS
ncbi:fimbrial major subunit CsuA/B family protein [Duganella sp. FT94W]|uniref:Fimbrial major subunit CsuA/B family protein n=1 Tax=Duganella lactea TaxID=2692173 RepID=A0ABW9V9N5_9BURK|nr:spore coat protein U domain-containing protein [Duganella lactea]MYM34337.1 fimbrial major subunit CsuA/B family protein [Duganella lactea]